MTVILQGSLPHDVGARRKLPGIAPLDTAAWLHVDAADLPFLRSRRQCVLRLPQTRVCVFSIHAHVLARLRPRRSLPVLARHDGA